MTPALIDFDREVVRRRGFAEFARRAWTLIPAHKGQPPIWNWHLDEVCRHYEALARGETTRLAVNIPPGYGKTAIASVLLVPWIWTFEPRMRVLLASYGSDLIHQAADDTLAILKSRWYRDRWGDIVRGSRKKSFRTNAGGQRIATTVAGAGTGFHGDMFLVDDPIKADDARTRTSASMGQYLKRASDWFANTVSSRGTASDFRVGLVMQRLHDLDPTNVLLRGGATHLCFPVRFERERRCVTPFGGDHRTIEGELLFPRYRDARSVESTAREMGGWDSLVASAQLQQLPSPPGGAIFLYDWFQPFALADAPFAQTHTVLSVDAAFKGSETSDFVACEVWGRRGTNYYCYHSALERMSFTATLERILALHAAWPTSVILIEDKANGPALIDSLRRHGAPVVPYMPRGSKEERARGITPFYAAKQVFHLGGAEWLRRKERNLARFPTAEHDDDVDATTQAIDYLRLTGGGGAWGAAVDDLTDFENFAARHGRLR